jgi:uncharacterized protein (TIGR02588 family)
MKSRPGPTPSTAERVTLVLSFLIVAVLIGVALIEEARIEGSEPAGLGVTFDVDRTFVRDGNYYVPYTVVNRGAQAIDAAQIRFEVLSGDTVVQSNDLAIQFLPLEGIQTGLFVTQHDPATHTFRASPVTLEFP